jgi:uncharacterized protein YndB with AHSA1/START domain
MPDADPDFVSNAIGLRHANAEAPYGAWLAVLKKNLQSDGGTAGGQPSLRVQGHSTGDFIMGNTVKMHRVLKAPAERVYRAFIDPQASAKWLAPNGFTCQVHHMDPKVGGTFKMSFTNFATGQSHAFGGEYKELKPHEKLRYTDKFDDPNLPGEIMVTVLLKEVSCGTEINITQENIPEVIPLEMCYLGWQDSMRQLADLVETAAP